jgi:oligopeptide/dipeptide ABC transporter ATP-binding protein
LPPDLIDPGAECRFSPRCPYVRDVCREREPELSERTEAGHLARCFGTEPGGWIQ